MKNLPKLRMIEVVAAIAISLALDCFSAAFAVGACSRRVKALIPLALATSFGAFQAGMIWAGWAGGAIIEAITRYDHWIAFALLAAAGIHMIRGGLSSEPARYETIALRPLMLLSVATSLDALAAGFSTPFLGLEVASASAASGLASFALAILGYYIGLNVRRAAGVRAAILGGAILLLLGFRILLEHLAAAA